MPELIPAAPGSPESGVLTIYYRNPFICEEWPFSLEPGANLHIYPTAGHLVDHFRIDIKIPRKVSDA